MNYNHLVAKYIHALLMVVLVSVFGLVFASPTKSLADIGGFGMPFGGRVLSRVQCTCGVDALLLVGSPVGGSFMLTPASRIYINNAPFPSNWVLGLASGFSTCFVVVPTTPPSCAPVGGGSVIKIMGTS